MTKPARSDSAPTGAGHDADSARPRFADRLSSALTRTGTPVCVGLDPVYEKLPIAVAGGHADACSAIEAFCIGILDAVAGLVPIVKMQSACFERYGSAGVAVLERVCEHARRDGLLTILDAKRGDIGISAAHYAAAAAEMGVDAVTVSPYLGLEPLTPFLEEGLGIFVLVRTSNPESESIQSPGLATGGTVAEMVAERVAAFGRGYLGGAGLSERGLSEVGAVVGATKASDASSLRERMPDQVFLVPGIGAQGGSVEDALGLARRDGTGEPIRDPARAGLLLTASRSILYPARAGEMGSDWARASRDAACELIGQVRGVLDAG